MPPAPPTTLPAGVAAGVASPTRSAVPVTVELTAEEWRAREAAHRTRADDLTAARRDRVARGRTHPVDDFLYTYYSYKPAVLRRWHPGIGVRLRDAAAEPRATWRGYRVDGDHVEVDAAGLSRERGLLLRGIADILRATRSRRAQFGCFGLHEWAMVYRDDAPRHAVPLRLGSRGTDAVVESHQLTCTHFDAFRFFTPEAVPRNRQPLDRAGQSRTEQPGCLHANMDLYKWAVKLGPLVPGNLLLDAFTLARDIRELDMRASPYDLTDWGYAPIAIETAEGKAEYVALQRRFAERADEVRGELIRIVAAAREAGATPA